MKKGLLRKVVFIGSCLGLLLLSLLVLDKQAYAQTESVSYYVEYMQTDARTELAMVNSLRMGSDAWAWNESDTQKIYYKNLQPLEYDYDLEKVAMLRCAEIVLSYSHVRPNGKSCFDAYSQMGYNGYHAAGENIAVGYYSVESVFDAWLEEDCNFSGQGHRRNMLSANFNRFGAAGCYVNGIYYWVMEFSNSSAPLTAVTEANDFQTLVSVPVELNDAAVTIVPSSSTMDITVGNSCDIPEASLRIHLPYTWGFLGINLTSPKVQVTVADPSVASLNGTVISGVKKGNTYLSYSALGKTVNCSVQVASKEGWILEDGKWRYFINGEMQTGWIKPSNTWYYLDENGIMQTGWVTTGGKKYYLASESGAMQTGWIWADENWYYASKSGAIQTGWIRPSYTWYYLDEDGKMLTGFQIVGGKKYYLAPSGAMQTGWIWADENWYYASESGAMQTGWIRPSYTWYYLDEDGKMLTGFQIVGGKKYYLAPSGAMQTGWIWADENWYYASESGAIQTGWIRPSYTWYYLNEDGIMQTGWIFVDGKYYYLESSGAWNPSVVK